MRIPGSAAAVAALGVQTTRLAVSAGNVANVSTDGYRAKRVVPVEMRGGGVAARIDEPSEPRGQVLLGDGQADRVASNVDVASEVVTQMSAKRAFEASLAVLRTGDELTKSVLDLVR